MAMALRALLRRRAIGTSHGQHGQRPALAVGSGRKGRKGPQEEVGKTSQRHGVEEAVWCFFFEGPKDHLIVVSFLKTQWALQSLDCLPVV